MVVLSFGLPGCDLEAESAFSLLTLPEVSVSSQWLKERFYLVTWTLGSQPEALVEDWVWPAPHYHEIYHGVEVSSQVERSNGYQVLSHVSQNKRHTIVR